MRLALFQAAGAVGEVAGNLARLERALADAADAGADLLVSPELFLTGYAMDAAAAGDSAALALEVAALSARHRLAHVWSQPVPPAPGTAPGAAAGASIGALVADADGRVLGTYRKVHLWGEGERGAFVPGDAPPLVVVVAGLSVGVAICYDVEFPETARAAALAGAALLVVPTAMDDARTARVLLPARALENGIVVAYANHSDATGAFCGESVVVGADGEVLARAGTSEERVLLTDLDPADIEAARARSPYLTALRASTYQDWQSARAGAGAVPSAASRDGADGADGARRGAA